MSPAETRDFADRMRKKYGQDKTGAILPGSDELSQSVSTMSGSNPDKQNVTLINGWNGGGKMYSQIGEHLANSNHLITLYKGKKTDGQGRNYYLFWHWSQTEDVSSAFTVKTEYMRNHLNLTNNSDVLHNFSPASPLTVKGHDYNIHVGATHKGVTMGISTIYTHGGGKVQPETR